MAEVIDIDLGSLDNNVIELNKDDFSSSRKNSDADNSVSDKPSVNFGGGIELLMNDKRKSDGSGKGSNEVDLGDLNDLEAELNNLTEDIEKSILRELSRYKSVLESSAVQYEPHQLAYYLKDLATHFHSYYNACKFIVDDKELTQARLSLIHATRQILINGLSILGVSAPESM